MANARAMRRAVLRFALRLPDAYEDHPWGESVAKVNKKVFVFLGGGEDPEHLGMSVKLGDSREQALGVPGAYPTRYGLGRGGWVTVPFVETSPPLEVLTDWVEESYRLVAPKVLVATLDAKAGRAVINVCLEIGAKRVFASALDWPGWSRAARDEEGALQALFEYRSRYRAVMAGRRLGFVAPKDASVLRVVERIPGNATTDFGAPGRIAKADRRRTTERDVRRLQSLLIACWAAFDEAAGSAQGRRLRTGARGGGRSLAAIVRHVDEADAGYLVRIGGKADRGAPLREQILEALTVAPRTGTPPPGPRGGTRWPVRYHARRSAWHALDHAWEIEDRLT